MKLRTLDGKWFKRIILAGSRKVISQQEELNKINVFPVPDGDTGSNMASTFESISQSAMNSEDDEISSVSSQLADSALNGARGNSGAILAQFFCGLADGFGKAKEVTMEQFSHAAHHATRSARDAISNPVEGTIITVMHDWSEWMKNHWHKAGDFTELLTHSLSVAKDSLKDTPKKLKVLAKANVVDAGAQGFVHFLQGVVDHLKAGANDFSFDDFKQNIRKVTLDKLGSNNPDNDPDLHISPHATHTGELEYQYCTECIVHGEQIDLKQVKAELADWGNSLVVVGNKHKLKVHIHTNDPERLFRKASEYGDLLETKADDMWAQYRSHIEWHGSREIALIVDSSASMPRELMAKYNIITIPMQLLINNKAYLDRINISHEKFYQELTNPNNTISTSQPLPADVQRAFERAQRKAKSAIGIFISGEMSGTYHNINTQANKLENFPNAMIDSRNVAGGMGLIIKVVAEAIHAGKSFIEVKDIAEHAAAQTHTFVSPMTIEYMIKGGRVSKPAGFVANLFKLLPVIQVRHVGKAEKLGFSFGKKRNRKKMLKHTLNHADKLEKPQFIIAHANSEQTAQKYAKTLKRRYNLDEIPIVSASPLLISHCGPGTIAISCLDESAYG